MLANFSPPQCICNSSTEPRPQHISEQELSVITSCFNRWKQEVKSTIEEYEKCIGGLKDDISETYEQEHLKHVNIHYSLYPHFINVPAMIWFFTCILMTKIHSNSYIIVRLRNISQNDDMSLNASIQSNYLDYLMWCNVLQHKYCLHAVMVHEGEAISGHYWSYVFNREANSWLKFNDISVTEATWQEVVKESEGGYGTASAYCLIYTQSTDSSEQPREGALTLSGKIQASSCTYQGLRKYEKLLVFCVYAVGVECRQRIGAEYRTQQNYMGQRFNVICNQFCPSNNSNLLQVLLA